jgi:hypothetical protein
MAASAGPVKRLSATSEIFEALASARGGVHGSAMHVSTELQDEDLTFVATGVAIAAGLRYLTRNGALTIYEDEVALWESGEDFKPAAVIAAAKLDDVAIVGKPPLSLGAGIRLRVGSRTYTVESRITHGSGIASAAKIRRAREAIRTFEAYLAEAGRRFETRLEDST